MSAKQRSQAVQYANRILPVLNRVEMLRESACEDFNPYGRQAANLWRTAQEMEEILIRDNGLPNLDGVLESIMRTAEAYMGQTGGDVAAPSYMKSAKALFEVIDYVKRLMASKPLMQLLDMIYADGYEGRYSPCRKMMQNIEAAKESERIQAEMDRAVAEEEAKGGEA